MSTKEAKKLISTAFKTLNDLSIIKTDDAMKKVETHLQKDASGDIVLAAYLTLFEILKYDMHKILTPKFIETIKAAIKEDKIDFVTRCATIVYGSKDQEYNDAYNKWVYDFGEKPVTVPQWLVLNTVLKAGVEDEDLIKEAVTLHAASALIDIARDNIKNLSVVSPAGTPAGTPAKPISSKQRALLLRFGVKESDLPTDCKLASEMISKLIEGGASARGDKKKGELSSKTRMLLRIKGVKAADLPETEEEAKEMLANL